MLKIENGVVDLKIKNPNELLDDVKLADIESESIVGQTLKSIADDIKTGLANLGGGTNL